MSEISEQQKAFLEALSAKLGETYGKETKSLVDALEKLQSAHGVPGAGAGEYLSWSEQAAKAIMEAVPNLPPNSPKGTIRTGQIPVDIPGMSPKNGEVFAPGFRQRLALVQKDVTSAQFPSPRTLLPFVPFPERPERVRDLMPVVAAATPVIEYARVTGFSNSAAVTAEGALKPQSDITTVKVTKTAKVIATFLPVSRQALADVGGLRAWLEGILEYFVTLEEDNQILNGVGPGDEHLDGILPDPGIQTQAVGAEASPATPKLIAIRKAITKIQIAFGVSPDQSGGDPNGLVVHPTAAEGLDLLTDTTGRYLLLPDGSPANAAGARNIWRLRVVVTPAIAAGTGLVGDFARASSLHVYEGLTVRVTDTHDDFFRRNLLAMLAEVREALAIPFPAFFCTVTGL